MNILMQLLIPSGFLIIKMNDIRKVKKDINIDEEVKKLYK